jgi:hypothetical protein
MRFRKSIVRTILPIFVLSWITVAPVRAQISTSLGAASGAASNLPADTHNATPASILKNSAISNNSSPALASVSNTDATESRTRMQRMTDDVKLAASRIARLTKVQRRKWEMAQAALPGFCHNWDRMLHDREVNNLSHLDWHENQGYETATYTGYGQVEACEAKESDEGVPIGKVRYEERNYYLVGKTTDEAKSHPKLLGVTKTLEIFSWEKDRWFY